ncbi:unnamed protein product (macronuclear) [Paramecium tetraurelia]|uniref:EF-hand domain-containing protein n=1 Tax=Paramecium tetraurelia TaxID=5888 RepID=A0DF07_PARTE|nr:uncharacterized protein GSPATT00016450001 [Paramecium tetraurelia]CAK81624.1 unnamed protein product [Paramecium tetraurelia]|eukprot:XP_001449021.1 hypothetical protein (macronuclear) [Paramecium tetraurelia strain d4-2]
MKMMIQNYQQLHFVKQTKLKKQEGNSLFQKLKTTYNQLIDIHWTSRCKLNSKKNNLLIRTTKIVNCQKINFLELIKNNKMCQQQNNNQIFNTNFTLNTIYNSDQLQIKKIEGRQQLNTENSNQSKLEHQQYGSGILNCNQIERKRGIAPNYRYGKSSQQTKERSETLGNKQNDYVSKQNNYQCTNERKKIFDADQPKIKYKQDLEQIKNIFTQLDSDDDGKISSEAINLRIGESCFQLIAPVLFHMQEQRMVLDFDSFVYLIISFNILIY